MTMKFFNVRKSSAIFAYILLIQLSTSCAGPAHSSHGRELKSSLAKKNDNFQRLLARDDPVEDVKSSVDDIITTTIEYSIQTTEGYLLSVEQEVINDAVSMGPSVLLLDEPIPESIAIEPEIQDVMESVSLEPEVIQDVKDPVVGVEIQTTETVETLPAQVAAPINLPLNAPVRVPMIPEDLEMNTTPLSVKQSDPVINSSEQGTNFSSLQFKKPMESKKSTSSGTKYGIRNKLEQPKRRPFVYNDAQLNPYLSEEQDQPIYLPPTFSVLPLAVSLYSGEVDFPKRPFGTHSSEPKKLDFPRISNTDENFDLHVDWW